LGLGGAAGPEACQLSRSTTPPPDAGEGSPRGLDQAACGVSRPAGGGLLRFIGSRDHVSRASSRTERTSTTAAPSAMNPTTTGTEIAPATALIPQARNPPAAALSMRSPPRCASSPGARDEQGAERHKHEARCETETAASTEVAGRAA